MANIIIFGGHGKVALLAAPLLVGRGDSVTAVIRNPEHAEDVRRTGAEPLVADLERMDVSAVANIIAGHDAVVWSAGAGGGAEERTMAVDRDAAIRSMDGALQAGVHRYVMVSYFGSSADHGVDPRNPFFAYAEAKAAADAHLRDTDLAWTILGPSALTDGDSSGLIDTSSSTASEVSRGTVAQVIAAVLTDDSTIHRTITFNDGATPITGAIRG